MKSRVAYIIILVIILMLILSELIYTFLSYDKVLLKNLRVEINSKLTLSELDLGNIMISEDMDIDTTKLGTFYLTIKYVKNNVVQDGIIEIIIEDTTPPDITFQDVLITKIGSETDLLKFVTVTDNSKEDIKVKVEGEYNFQKEGTYNLKYIAVDSSKNERVENFILQVVDEDNIIYPKLDEPNGEKKIIGKSSKGYDIYTIDDSVYIDGYLIVNKTYSLADNFVPDNTYKSSKGVSKECNTCINNIAYQAYLDMKKDASDNNLNINLTSGYRPYNIQKIIYNNYIKKDGKEKADTYSARPGHSEHQTGLTFDLNSIDDSFTNTLEGKWVNDNCYKYGFIIRYPKDKDNITGFKYESWHLRYVGEELSKILYNDGNWITLEEYFGITSKYSD